MSSLVSQATRLLLEQQGRLQELDLAERLQIQILSLADPLYPEPLRLLSDAPPLLYLKGQLPPLARAVACVGTRKPTHWGLVAAQRICSTLASEGCTLISGLAQGIDAIVHQAALDAGTPTVAVLPCSLDQISPRKHAALADAIVQKGGALLSEQPPGTRIQKSHFVRRNRLISGLARATLILQAASGSGTLHTARFAQKQGRILCVAQPAGRYAHESQSQGNRELLQEPHTLPLRSKADYPHLLDLLAC